jgi:nucleoside-diphosphate-sugar epimerase
MPDYTKKVLITGACGHIGSVLVSNLVDRYNLTLVDVRRTVDCDEQLFLECDITDLGSIRTACFGIDVVLHLAATSQVRASWERLLPNNIVGVHNVFRAAYEAKCSRVIFASSDNTVLGYPKEDLVTADMPVRPINLYGATKVWGEALARFYADQKGLSCICLRLGWVTSRDSEALYPDNPRLDLILTHHDLIQLIIASIEAPDDLRFGIFHGISNNSFKQYDIGDARSVLGYEPRDDAFALAGVSSNKQQFLKLKQTVRWLKNCYRLFKKQ